MTIWTVTLSGVYDHGIAGVYATEAEALRRATELEAQSDGYHDFRVDEFAVGEAVSVEGGLGRVESKAGKNHVGCVYVERRVS